MPCRTNSRAALIAGALCLAVAELWAQAPGAATAPASQVSSPSTAPPALSPLLQPALDTLQQTIEGLKLDKWKGGSVRAEAERNISSIMSDLENTLPALLQAADADPALVSKMLPVLRNVDALYDVVLRVFDGARVAAPAEQAAQLQQAMSSLESARRALNDRLQAAAAAEEKQVGELRVTLKAQAAPPVCPVQPAPSCPVPAPAKKAVKRKPKPVVKPPSPAPGGSSGASPAAPDKPSN